ncbi:hypothetical protein D3C84_917060 [compost metagenome]
MRGSPQAGRYDKPIDRESAYEMLTARAAQAPAEPPAQDGGKAAKEQPGMGDLAGELLGTFASQAMKTAVRQAANQLGRQLVRGLMGSLLGGGKRR